MRSAARALIVLCLFTVLASNGVSAERFRLLGEWQCVRSNGVTVRFIFGYDQDVTWIVEEPGKPLDVKQGFRTLEGQNPFTIDIHDFTAPKLKGISFRGLAEVLSFSEFRMDGMLSNKGPRPTSFGPDTMVFVAKKSALNSVIPTARIDGTTYTNLVVEDVNSKTVTFSHTRGVGSLNPAKMTREERDILGVPEPIPPPAPAATAPKKQINLSSLPFTGKTIIKIFYYALFCGIAPFLIRIAAAIVRVEDITGWRCLRAGLGGLIAFATTLILAVQTKTESQLLFLGFMALLWMTFIQIALKTSIPKTVAVWVMTHGTIFLAGTTVSHFFDMDSIFMQVIAKN